MNSIPSPRLITTPVREFHPDTRRLLALLNLRSTRVLTLAEQQEYEEVGERCDKRIAQQLASDLANDTATESHAFPESRVNFHD